MQYNENRSDDTTSHPIFRSILTGKLLQISRPLSAAFLGTCLAIVPAIATRADSIDDAPVLMAQATFNNAVADVYMVYVNGDSPNLLQTVQRVEPTAFRRFLEIGGVGQTVIQAGVFQQLGNAESRARELQSLAGLSAEITSVPASSLTAFAAPAPAPAMTAPITASPAIAAGPANLPPSDPGIDYSFTSIPDAGTTGGGVTGVTAPPPITAVPPAPTAAPVYTTPVISPAASAPVPPSVYSTSTPVYSAPAVDTFASPTPPPLTATYYDAGPSPLARGYYVSIPAGSEAELAVLNEEVIALRTGGWGLFPRKGPLGHHVAVGPFAKRTAAESWSEYYRSNGLDARVFRSTR